VGSRRPKWNFFGPAPLLDGEDPAAYERAAGSRLWRRQAFRHSRRDLGPRRRRPCLGGALRLRRLKANLITAKAHNGLEQILQPLSDWESADTLSKAWARRDPKAIKEVDALLASADLTMDAVMAETLALELDKVERIDRMIMSAEARRNAVLREVDRHRASVAQALRQAANVEDAQFEEVGAKQIVDRNAA
jgi:hypothetical protein